MARVALILIPIVLFAQSPAEPTPPDAQAPPDAAEQSRIIAALRKSAMRYEGHLPDFICTKVTMRSIDPTGSGEHLQQKDVLEERVAFSGGRVLYTPLRIDGKPTKKTHAKLGPVTEDSLLAYSLVPAYLFGPRAPVTFEWKRRDTIDGVPVHVIAYRVRPSVLFYPDGRKPYQMGFHGLAWVSVSDNSLVHIEEHDDAPPGYPIADGGDTVDYAVVSISGLEFLLPVRAATFGRVGKASWRNSMKFVRYGKFQADASLSFETANPAK